MLGSSLSVYLVLHLLLLTCRLTNARPTDSSRAISLVVRQNDGTLTQPVTMQTQEVLQTASGPMLEACILTFTPVTGPNGEPLVQEQKACTVTPVTANASPTAGATSSAVPSSSDISSSSAVVSSSSASAALSTAASTTGSPAASIQPVATVASLPSVSSAPVVSSAASTDSPSSSSVSASTASPASTAISSSVSLAESSATSSTTPTSTESVSSAAETNSVDPANGAGANPNPTDTSSSATSSSTPSGTAAADSAASSAPPFKLPGTSLSVLPIGLAVFAGISVIALIVVGLVTYERTKYRRKFRQQKLAESGAAMGYGGMAAA